MKEPLVHVGIMSAPQISFELSGDFAATAKDVNGEVHQQPYIKGLQQVSIVNGKIHWNNHECETLRFDPTDESEQYFELHDVVIGINFHWERKENQRFRGGLKFIIENNQLSAIDMVKVEDYLTSVISSEMSATASLELLKAHAVISRSWLLANIANRMQQAPDAHPIFGRTAAERQAGKRKGGKTDNEQEKIVWYDNDAHTHFDVCADDHCQRYQGITRASTELVKQAIAETYGQVLTYDGKLCDARFSKCCGGAFEEFEYCWEDVKYAYLKGETDQLDEHQVRPALPNLTVEAEADKWIRSAPSAFCNTRDKEILGQVLNNYDQETTDFYRWRVAYTQEELSALVKERSGEDYGLITDLIPVARGTSGRLWKLKIVGTKQSKVIGKELEIRRTLSPSHLYSSAFVVDKENDKFILTGAGWGHGVGLCQIGAAVMGAKGYKYDAILLHYYIDAQIESIYKK